MVSFIWYIYIYCLIKMLPLKGIMLSSIHRSRYGVRELLKLFFMCCSRGSIIRTYAKSVSGKAKLSKPCIIVYLFLDRSFALVELNRA